jgi:four helix bundle protein
MSNEVTKKILDGMIDLSVEVMGLLEKELISHSIKDQLIRSITSIGANYSEAQDASSKKDFLNKIYIAKKEAAESVYWLKLITRVINNDTYMKHQDSCQKYVMMLQKIVNSTRDKS